MECKNSGSQITKRNWFLDAFLMMMGLVTILSGIYFLYFPNGGYQGGRNPYYGITILFERSTWDWLHTWIGLAMIITAVVHLALHWKWVVSTTRRVFNQLFSKQIKMNSGAWTNILVDGVIAASFFVCAVSGVYFLLNGQGHFAVSTDFLFSRSTWDLVHTWSGIVFISSALVHFYIHWMWVSKVTRKLFVRKPCPQVEAL